MRDNSVKAELKTWRVGCFLGLVLLIPACRSTATPSTNLAAELAGPTGTTTSWKPITFVDRPELQAGAGGMNVETVPEFSSTDSGLNYRVLRTSDGKKPTAASTVSVHYRGWLNNGKVFDSSYERGEPTSFPLRNVIAGWTEGMQLVGEGGMIELWVPSDLAYGESGSPGSIPAHSNLHFIVELVSVD